MEQLNLSLFHTINANPNLHGIGLWLALFAAKYLIFVAEFGLIGLWIWGDTKTRKTVVFAFLCSALGLFIDWLIGTVYFHPRPFELGIGHTFIYHAADSSFPSDHTTSLASLSFMFLWRDSSRSFVGLLLLLITLWVGWARIYIGVHYPFDILGSLFVSFIATIIISYLTPWISRYLIPFPEYIHHQFFNSTRKMASKFGFRK
ncbi:MULTISPECIES: undecaprenyl-diphosphatase [Legionella]|uniref:undecaprenyl-diphosphate phosphatase n=1 Tax=Legionella drozanskii LLAP-1 TaxID=1212489 RepID=A0A0W0SYT8_9GAMM|nr:MULTISPECIES: undecaprenyl-diphosphatase [Legionella]KTC88117.1 putative undecaprenyl-diphosphatase YbjG [Legionella drozanskii LLAP-1]